MSSGPWIVGISVTWELVRYVDYLTSLQASGIRVTENGVQDSVSQQGNYCAHQSSRFTGMRIACCSDIGHDGT